MSVLVNKTTSPVDSSTPFNAEVSCLVENFREGFEKSNVGPGSFESTNLSIGQESSIYSPSHVDKTISPSNHCRQLVKASENVFAGIPLNTILFFTNNPLDSQCTHQDTQASLICIQK